MTLNITRRQALKIAVAGALAPIVLPDLTSEYVRPVDFQPSPYGDSDDWTPAQVAKLVAGMELQSQQFNRPKKWRRLKYDNAIQWRDGRDGRLPLIAWYGIGPAEWTAARLPELVDWISNCEDLQECAAEHGWPNVLGSARIARGRSFGIVSCGRLSPRLRAELRKPAWKRDRSIVV